MKTPSTMVEAFAEVCDMDAPLGSKLAAYAAYLRDLNSPVAIAYDRLVDRLGASGAGLQSPDIGDVFPDFLLPDSSGRLRRLDDYLPLGPLVVSFNRGHWCSFCKIELHELAQASKAVEACGGRMVSIMPESQQFAAHLKPLLNGQVDILSDMFNAYALSLGLVIWIGDEIRGLMHGTAVETALSQSNPSWMVPVPATFVIGWDGRVVARLVDPDFRRRMDIADILTALGRAA